VSVYVWMAERRGEEEGGHDDDDAHALRVCVCVRWRGLEARAHLCNVNHELPCPHCECVSMCSVSPSCVWMEEKAKGRAKRGKKVSE
jgi:hypothetical protein